MERKAAVITSQNYAARLVRSLPSAFRRLLAGAIRFADGATDPARAPAS